MTHRIVAVLLVVVAGPSCRTARDESGPPIVQDMLAADDSHLVNIRLSKDIAFSRNRRLALSGDVFNLLNVGAATGFLSADARSSNFGVPTNYVPARVGQLGLRLTF